MARLPCFTAAALPLILAACATPGGNEDSRPAATAGGLADTTWQLVELQSNKDAIGTTRPDDSSKYEIHFARDGSVSVRLDCNRAAGHWESEGPGQLSFTPLAMTRALCLGPSLDDRIGRELGFVASYVMNGDRLTLNLKVDAGNQVWKRVNP